MKYLILALLSCSCTGDKPDCNSVKIGTFKLESIDESTHVITRTEDKQTENVTKKGLISEFSLKWTSDCTYILFDRKVIKGVDEWPAEINADTLFNEIIEVSEGRHKVISFMKRFDSKLEATLITIK